MKRFFALLVFITFCWSAHHTTTLPAFHGDDGDFDHWVKSYSNEQYKANSTQAAYWILTTVALFVLLCCVSPLALTIFLFSSAVVAGGFIIFGITGWLHRVGKRLST